MNHPTHLTYQFHLIQAIRDFFRNEGFTDVLTPPMVENPGMEVHIHPFSIIKTRTKEATGNYLHTSPEFHMKWLLSQGLNKIFQISYCFRDEPSSPHHRPQFLMLEWYRAHQRYEHIMSDVEKLITFSKSYLQEKKVKMRREAGLFKIEKYTIQELFLEYLNIDILQFLEKEDLADLIKKNFKEVPLPSHCESMLWEDYYFLLFLNQIESQLKERPCLLLYEFPYHLSALSTLKQEDQRVCERFEVYLNGIELCNCFNELTDYLEQKRRFAEQAKIKKDLYHYQLPEPTTLWKAFEQGLPPSAGVALGVERLLLGLTDISQPFYD